jgi:DNA-binding GntR family transcriptional regulator
LKPRNRFQNAESAGVAPDAVQLRRPSAALKLWQEAYYRIRERILRGDFPLGSPLNRRKLAEELRVSLLPVSEALRRLELDGLVEAEARAGTRVKIPTPKDIEDHITIRAALECESARLFCQRATADERKDLLARADHLDYLRARSGDLTLDKQLSFAIHSHHLSFHLRIADGARCKRLRELVEQNQVLTLNWLYDVASENESSVAFHADLAQALAGDDLEEAARRMRGHIWFTWEHLVREFKARYWKDGDFESEQAGTAKRQPTPERVRRWRTVGLTATRP